MLDDDKKEYYKNLDSFETRETKKDISLFTTFLISTTIICVLSLITYFLIIGESKRLSHSKQNRSPHITPPTPKTPPWEKNTIKQQRPIQKKLKKSQITPPTHPQPKVPQHHKSSKPVFPKKQTKHKIAEIQKKHSASSIRLPKVEQLTIDTIRKEASAGNPHSQAILGMAYLYGDFNLRQNKDEANTWLQLAASKKAPLAVFLLSIQNNTPVKLPNEADVKKHPFLLVAMGTYCEKKHLSKQAFHFYNLAAQQKCSLGEYHLGRCYRYGIGAHIDLTKAETLFKRSAKNGLATAYTALGELYLNKRKNDTNLKQAIAYLKKGVEQNDPKSFFYLGNCYADGLGVFANEEKAKKLYKQALSKGVVDAAFPYAYYLDKNDNNWQEALKWYNTAIKNGDDRAALMLGDYYANGVHFPKNNKKALEMYAIAIKKDNPMAFFKIGNFLSKGKGIQQDLGKAATFYQKAASLNLPEAQLMLSHLYERGIGVPKNMKTAIHWAILASKQGYSPAKKQVNGLIDKKEKIQISNDKFKLEEKLRVALHNLLQNDFSKKSVRKFKKLLPQVKLNETRYSLLVILYFISYSKQRKQDILTFKNQIYDEFSNRPGIELQFSDVNMTCPICYGKGVVTHKCPRCHGTGICPRCHGRKEIGDPRIGLYECITCHGSGICPKCDGKRFITITCPVCNGAGKFPSSIQARKQAILLIKKMLQHDQIPL